MKALIQSAVFCQLTSLSNAIELSPLVEVGEGGLAWIDSDLENGRIHLVFDGKYRAGQSIDAMGEVESITPHFGGDFSNPKIDVDPAGIPHVVYQFGRTGSAKACYYVAKNGNKWGAPEKFADISEVSSSTQRTMLPDVCANANGEVLTCFWTHRNEDPRGTAMYRWRDENGNWSDYGGGLTKYHAGSPKVEESGGKFYLHYASNDFDKRLAGPLAFGEEIKASDIHFASREINRSFQNEGTNFALGPQGLIVAAGNFRKTPDGGGVGIWVSQNLAGTFQASVIAELSGRPPHGKEEGHQQPDIAIDEATGEIYITYFNDGDRKAYYHIYRQGKWSEKKRLLPELEGKQGYFRCGPSVADIPGAGVVVCVKNDETIFLRTLSTTP